MTDKSNGFFLQDDPETLVKCLSIASGLLQNIFQSGLSNPTLSTLVETLVSFCGG